MICACAVFLVLLVVDQEPGQFYDLRIVTNFDWQPKLSFRAKESIAAYRDIKHEELFEDAATGLQALFASTDTLLNSLVGGSGASSGGGGGGLATSSGGGGGVGGGAFSDKLHHRQLMVLAGKCSDTINSLRRSNIREARIWFRGRTAMLSDALQWLPRRLGRLPASYLQFLRQPKAPSTASSSKAEATTSVPSSISSSSTSAAATSTSVASTSSFAGGAQPAATVAAASDATASASNKPPEKKWSYQFYILDAISVRDTLRLLCCVVWC